MLGTLQLGRPFGVRTAVHGTFWLLPAFFLLAGWLRGGVTEAVLDTAVLLAVFGCVLLHEFGHALAARWYGIRTHDITLYPIGGVARLERIPERPWPEIVIALAGPLVNVLIAAALFAVLLADGLALGVWPSGGHTANVVLHRVMVSNVFLVLFNLIPAFPMDGGRVLRAGLSWFTDRVTATTAAANIGTGFAVLFGVAAFLLPQPMLFVLAISLYLMGRQEAAAVRYQEAERRRWRDAEDDARGWSPFVRQVHSAEPDGWVYDAATREWTEYRNGFPRRRFREV